MSCSRTTFRISGTCVRQTPLLLPFPSLELTASSSLFVDTTLPLLIEEYLLYVARAMSALFDLSICGLLILLMLGFRYAARIGARAWPCAPQSLMPSQNVFKAARLWLTSAVYYSNSLQGALSAVLRVSLVLPLPARTKSDRN